MENGNYIILIKEDNSIQIHGAKKIKPLNYQPEKSKIIMSKNKIITQRKNETIEINIDDIHWIHSTKLSNNEPKVTKTEEELVNKIIENISNNINDKIKEIHKEYKVENGKIDIYIVGENKNHAIEVKRHKVNINTCIQVKKYLECLDNTLAYVAAPSIAKNAIKYCNDNNITYLQEIF